MTGDRGLSRVVIAISAYRSNDAIIALLGQVFEQGGEAAAAVIVVDSEGDGSLEAALARRGWPVSYENSPINLGSAGNLVRRLELAARHDADWCLAINHDGMFTRRMADALVRCGREGERVGAVYPKRVLTNRGGTVLRPHRAVFALPRYGSPEAAPEHVAPTAWNSSNGALYSLEAVRQGIRPWADLWMGWEDLAYGWQLSSAGWQQLYCPQAQFHDDYEFAPVRLFGRRFFITRKPPWYGYYQVRNLLLILKRTRPGIAGWRFLAVRLLREIGFAFLFRGDKRSRLRLLWLGLVDGLHGVTGRGRGR